MEYYKSYRIIDGKPKWIVEDENENIVNRIPYKEELTELEKFPEKDGRSNSRLKISNNELLGYLRQFEKENGRIPVICEFNENLKCPNGGIYFKRFGSWNNALNLAGIIHITINAVIKTRVSRWSKSRWGKFRNFFWIEDIKKWLDGGS